MIKMRCPSLCLSLTGALSSLPPPPPRSVMAGDQVFLFWRDTCPPAPLKFYTPNKNMVASAGCCCQRACAAFSSDWWAPHKAWINIVEWGSVGVQLSRELPRCVPRCLSLLMRPLNLSVGLNEKKKCLGAFATWPVLIPSCLVSLRYLNSTGALQQWSIGLNIHLYAGNAGLNPQCLRVHTGFHWAHDFPLAWRSASLGWKYLGNRSWLPPWAEQKQLVTCALWPSYSCVTKFHHQHNQL